MSTSMKGPAVVIVLMVLGSLFYARRTRNAVEGNSPAAVTLDTRPTIGALKPPVASLQTPGRRVTELSTPNGKVLIGQRMSALYETLPDPIVEDSENDDYVVVSAGRTFPGVRYVYRYALSDGRKVVIRYARRLPMRPYRIISDDQPGAGERQSARYPFLVQEITVE